MQQNKVYLGLVILLCTLVNDAIAQGPPPARVRVEPATLEVVEQRRDVLGELVASARSAVASEESGRVNSVGFDVGDIVERGAVLASLDASLLEIDIRIIESEIVVGLAAIEEQAAELAKEERDVERLKELTTLDGASRRELEDAKIEVLAAKARLTQANAQLEVLKARISRLRSRIDDMVIRAPFSGRVVQKMTEVGEWIGEGDVVAELVDLSSVDLYVDLPERFIGALGEEDAMLNVFVDAVGFVADIAEFSIIAEGDALARTFPIRARLSNPDGVLKPGMSVRASVPTGVNGEALTVSKDAVIRTDVGFIVYFNGGGVAAPMPVDVAFSTGTRYALRPGGLQPGMQVVVEGNERLFGGQPLIDIDAAPQDQSQESDPAQGPTDVKAGANSASDEGDA